MMQFVHPDDCDCYECTEPRKACHNGHSYIKNDMKHHTFGQPCEKCGKPKSEYKDLGRKGLYVCWWCNKRAEPLVE